MKIGKDLVAASATPLGWWQTAYVPVYTAWAWMVVVIFPLVFGFR